MSPKKLAHLPQLFRGPFLRKIAGGTYYSELAERLSFVGLRDLLDCNLGDIFSEVYKILVTHYRTEYVYKNSLTTSWLDTSISDKSFVTDEFKVGKSRVDLAIFSNSSTAYEIKSEFDSTLRLSTQTTEYTKVFDHVYVVGTHGMKSKIEQAISSDIGIILLQESGELQVVKESASHAKKISLGVTFDCLRQKEMLAIANKLSGEAISVPSSRVYTECKARFRQLLPFEAHHHAAEQFRNRQYSSASESLLKEVPPALKHAALTFRASNEEMHSLRQQLCIKPRPYKAPSIPKIKMTHNHKVNSAYEQLPPVLERKTKRIACTA